MCCRDAAHLWVKADRSGRQCAEGLPAGWLACTRTADFVGISHSFPTCPKYHASVARRKPAPPELHRFSVLTADQAAAVIGLDRRSVLDAAKRRRANGAPVSWDHDDPDNAFNCVLVLSSWVLEQAYGHDGPQASIEPTEILLPIRPGETPVPRPGSTTEIEHRIADQAQLLESYRSEAAEERMARLEHGVAAAEAERDAAQKLYEREHDEVLRLRSSIAALVTNAEDSPAE